MMFSCLTRMAIVRTFSNLVFHISAMFTVIMALFIETSQPVLQEHASFLQNLSPKIEGENVVGRSRMRRNLHPEQFGTDYITSNFGINGQLNLTGVNAIMDRLSLSKNLQVGARHFRGNECLTAEEVFVKGGFNKTELIQGIEVDKISSILLGQVLQKSCLKPLTKPKSIQTKEEPEKAWGFAVLFVTIISLASMFGAFVVPLMNREYYQKLLLFMVSLAVGVLCGSGIFHLLPHTFGFGKDGDFSYLWKGTVIVGGIYFFFITENIMKMYIRFSDWKGERGKKKKLVIENTDIQNGDTLVQPKPSFCAETVHDHHALDSVHLTDRNCLHEHGMDSLHMAGDHQIKKENTLEYFVTNPSQGACKTKRIAPVAWMIIIGDGLHNFIDGLAIGAAFTSTVLEGISTSLAILCEELPHELGDFAILLNSGMSYKMAILCNFLSACTCYAGMVIGVLLGSKTSAVTWIYAMAAGMFLYISLVDMLPEATGMQVTVSGSSRKDTLKNFGLVNFGILLGFSIMFLLALYGGEIQI